MSDPQIIAGACGYGAWPTNSLEGARACLDAPVAGIEIDVHLTADGHVVAHHDYRIAPEASRLNGAFLEAPGPLLRETSLAELRRYDLGRLKPDSRELRRYPDKRGLDGVVMPSLPDLLDLLSRAPGERRWIFVEIKTDPPNYSESADPRALTDAVLRDIDGAGWADRAKIIAFDWSILRDLKARRPEILTAHLTVPDVMKPQVKRTADGASPWNDGCDPKDFGGSEAAAIAAHGGREWSPHISDVTPARVADAKAHGLAVGVWGVSKAEEIAAMSAMGADVLTVSGPAWSA